MSTVFKLITKLYTDKTKCAFYTFFMIFKKCDLNKIMHNDIKK